MPEVPPVAVGLTWERQVPCHCSETTHNLGDRTCSGLILSREGLGMRLGIHTGPGLVLLHLWHVDER